MFSKKQAWLAGGLLASSFAIAVQTQAATCSYRVDNDWGSGFTASIVITNNTSTAVNGWTVNWKYNRSSITNLWNANQSGTNPYTASNLSWNASIQPGQSVTFGFQGNVSGGAAEVPVVTGTVCGGVVSSSSSSVATTSSSSSKPSSSSSVATSSSVVSSVVSSSSSKSSVPSSSSSSVVLSSSSKPSSSSSSSTSSVVGDNNDDWLHVSGNRIVDKNGKAVWLTGVNWFGFNASERVFHGLWSVNLDATLKAVAERGFNIVRVPISVQLLLEWKNGQATVPSVNTWTNPDLAGLNSLQVFDAYLKISKKYGLKVLLDVHSAEADNSGHVYPLWYKGTFTNTDFFNAWAWVADRYKNDDTIVAYDLKNEPHGAPGDSAGFAKWDTSTDPNNWKYVAEEASKRILASNPNALILVEGIEFSPKDGANWSSTNKADYISNWWGGNLRPVAKLPINVPGFQQQIMYSPHDYGPLVFQQAWFYPGFNKDTLYKDVWYDNWLYIHEKGISPLLIGEWGGFMDGGPNQAWMNAMRDLIIQYKLHHTFWCLNPNSGDTGGLLGYDWTTWDEAKYALVKPTLWKSSNGKFVSLDHKVGLGGNAVGVNLTDYYANGGLEPVGP